MAVDQTRAFFRQRDGALVDNPAVGRDLAEHYWAPGNSRPFLSYVQALTGRPFSADDAAARVDRPLEEALAEARADIERGRATPASEEPVRLEGAIRMVHGDEVVAEMEQDGSFEEMAAAYGAWIRAQEEQA
jgi:hypothetical protein